MVYNCGVFLTHSFNFANATKSWEVKCTRLYSNFQFSIPLLIWQRFVKFTNFKKFGGVIARFLEYFDANCLDTKSFSDYVLFRKPSLVISNCTEVL